MASFQPEKCLMVNRSVTEIFSDIFPVEMAFCTQCCANGGGALGCNILWAKSLEAKFRLFFALFIHIQKYCAKLNKMLNQYLDFSSLVHNFAAFKAKKHLL